MLRLCAKDQQRNAYTCLPVTTPSRRSWDGEKRLGGSDGEMLTARRSAARIGQLQLRDHETHQLLPALVVSLRATLPSS